MQVNHVLRARESAGAPLQSRTTTSRRILVAEDDISFRQMSTEILANSGYDVDAAEDGAAAWQALNTDTYDLLITDHNMPRLTGFELLRKLRAAHMVLPVIMLTGVLPNEEFTRHPWLQPEATLLKPFTIAELLWTVKEVLRATDASREQLDWPPNRKSQPAANPWQL